jgi:Fic family protein/DNA-binding XRE family transcriptional regulator
MYIENRIRKKRKELGLSMKALGLKTGIDQALISKYENGKRNISQKHSKELSRVLELDLAQIRKEVLANKIVDLLQYEQAAEEILLLAEDRIEYLTSTNTFNVPEIDSAIQKKLDAIDELQQEWNKKRPLDKTHLAKLKEYFNIKYTFNSNQIEGNTLTLQETHLVIHEGITVDGKSMREHLEAVNHSEAIDFLIKIVQEKTPLDLRLVKNLHQLVLKSIDSPNAGVWRNVPVMISGSEHKPPQPYMLDKLMEDYIVHYNRQKNNMHPVILAAEMHERLLTIHPFIDGNGRTSRLVMNFILMQYGYTLTIVKGDPGAKQEYYNALQNAQVNNEPTIFYHLIADRVLASLHEHLEWVN